MDYRLEYPKKKPADAFAAGFDTYTPQAQQAPSRYGQAMGQQPQAQQAGPDAGMGLAAINPWLAVGKAGFDIYGGLEKAEKEETLAQKAEAAYQYERDKEAQELERQRELQRIQSVFQFGNYAGNERQGLHANYDDYYRNIGL